MPASSSAAIKIRLREPEGSPAKTVGASDDDLLSEITIKLNRQTSKQIPSDQPKAKRTNNKQVPPPLGTARILAQISSLLLAVFIGLNFGGLMCLAFLLFFCLPVATSHWAVPDEKATST